MSTPDRETDPILLLRTKYQRPRLRENLVSRPRLLDQLNTGLRPSGLSEIDRQGNGSEAGTYGEGFSFAHKLILISAPAGYGKSTLLNQWLNDCPCSSAWLSLDAGDSDPRVFLTYLIGAIQSRYREACQSTSRLLKSHQLPPQDYLVSLLTNELVDLAGRLVLALDDYHRIEGESVPKLTTALLDYLPPQVCLAIASRQDPNLPLNRFRANGVMTELRVADLSFTSDEARVFLERSCGKQLGDEIVETLDKRTEGWIVGLRLAALSLRGTKDLAAFVKAFKASGHRYVMDYLIDEVISQQPQAIRNFLLRTSILDRFCAPLCDVVLGRQDSQAVLEKLEQDNLFLVPLDFEGKWYRYHHLFREVLANRMQAQLSGNEIIILHGRASSWLADHEFVEEALTHSLAAGDLNCAARLVEDRYRSCIDIGQSARLRRWLAQLPDTIIDNRPGLILALCWCLHLEFNFEETFPLSEEALAILEEPERSPDLAEYERQFMLGEAHLILSQVLYFTGEFEQGLAYVENALAQISPAFSYGLSGAWYYWLEFNQVLGRRDEAIEQIHKVIRDYPVNSPFTMNIHLGLCYVYRSAANFPRLSKAGRAFLKAAQKADLPESVAFAHFHLGVLHYEWNELEKARHHFEAAINLRYFAHALSYQGSLQGLSLVLLAQDQPNDFQDTMAMMNEFARQTESDFLLTCNRSFQARLSLLEGDLVRANRMSLADYDTPQVEPMVEYEVPTLTRAKVLAQSNTQESLQQANLLLEELLDHAESTHITWRQIEILALQALVLEAQNRNEQALSRLKQAVALAKLGWLVRTFVDLGPSLAKLLRQLAVRNIESDYVSHVLEAFNSESIASLPRQDSRPRLATPLTEREQEVLILLAQRLTNKEIAQQLIISPKTVKRHASNIYEKLGVSNRKQAAIRARDLGILPSPNATD